VNNERRLRETITMKVMAAAAAIAALVAGCGGGSSSTHQNPDTIACHQVAATGSLSPDAAGEALTKISNEPGLSASLADQIEAWAQPGSTLDDWHALVATCQHYGVRNDVMEGNVPPSPAPPPPGSL